MKNCLLAQLQHGLRTSQAEAVVRGCQVRRVSCQRLRAKTLCSVASMDPISSLPVACTHHTSGTGMMQDDDLRQLRERREWVDAMVEVKGGECVSVRITSVLA